MAASWHLIKAFIREATEDEDLNPVAEISTAYAKLRAIQRGHFETATINNDGLQQISSQVKDVSFSFAVPSGLGAAEIIATAEQALEMIEGKTVAQARAFLVRRKRTQLDMRTYRL